MKQQADYIPPVDAEAVYDASQAGREQSPPSLQILDLDRKLKNAKNWTVQPRALFLIKRSGSTTEVNNGVPTLMSPGALEVIVGMEKENFHRHCGGESLRL
jgi:hypothetical protein